MAEKAKPNAARPKARARPALWIGVMAVVVLAYPVVRYLVGAHVDRRVEGVIGATLPDFEMQDLDGRTWTRNDLLGRRLLLSFFRSRCPTCRGEKSSLQTLAAESQSPSAQGQYRVVSVMTDRLLGYPEEETRETLRLFEFKHPVLFANSAFLDRFHGGTWAHVTPITFVFDAKGVCVRALRGHQTLEALRSALQ